VVALEVLVLATELVQPARGRLVLHALGARSRRAGGGGGAFFPSANFYTWAGTVFGGDSGSGVMVPTQQAAGDLTHGLGIDVVPLPVGYGTRTTKILDFLGKGFYLVNADGTLSRETSACSGLDAPWDPIVGIKARRG
jgi:hypothetical protein